MKIRAFVDNDWVRVREIYDLSKPDEVRASIDPPFVIPLDADPAMLALFRESVILVADVEGEVAGFGGYRGNYISWLFVDPKRRRQGIARTLVEEMLRTLSGPVTLNVLRENRPARNLYASLGFSIAKEVDGQFNGEPVHVVTLKHEGEA